MGKKGQVTIFIIVGLLLVALVAGFFLLQTRDAKQEMGAETGLSATGQEMVVIQYTVDECVQRIFERSVEKYGYGRPEEIKAMIELHLDSCLNMDKMRESFPGVKEFVDKRVIEVVENLDSFDIQIYFPIEYNLKSGKGLLEDFSYTFYKVANEMVPTDETGKVKTDITLLSGDGTMSIQLQKGTIITDEYGNPSINPRIEINVGQIPDEEKELMGYYIYDLYPEGLHFSTPVRIDMKIPDNIPENQLQKLSIAFKNPTGLWAAIPSYIDNYERKVIGNAYHFTQFGIAPNTRGKFSYGTGFIFKEVTRSGQRCEDLEWEEYLNPCDQLMGRPPARYILLPKDATDVSTIEDCDYVGQGVRVCAEGLTHPDEAEDFQAFENELPIEGTARLDWVDPLDYSKGQECKADHYPARYGYESRPEVGGNPETPSTLRLSLKTKGSLDPLQMETMMPYFSKGKETDDTIAFAGSDSTFMHGDMVEFFTSEYSVAGSVEETDALIEKTEGMDGCIKAAAKFTVKGNYMPCSIDARLKYMGSAGYAGGEVDKLTQVKKYLMKEAELAGLGFEYFNLPLSAIEQYNGLPEDLKNMYSGKDMTEIYCCADDEKVDPDSSLCVPLSGPPDCDRIGPGEEYELDDYNQVCKCSVYTITPNARYCRYMTGCATCTVDQIIAGTCTLTSDCFCEHNGEYHFSPLPCIEDGDFPMCAVDCEFCTPLEPTDGSDGCYCAQFGKLCEVV